MIWCQGGEPFLFRLLMLHLVARPTEIAPTWQFGSVHSCWGPQIPSVRTCDVNSKKAVGGSWKRSMWGWSDDISYRCWIFTRNAPNGECARQWRMNIGMCMWAEVLTEIPGKDLRDLWLSWVRPYLQQVAVVVAQTINHTWQRLHSPTQFDGLTILEVFPSSSVEKMKLRIVNWTSSPLCGNLLKGFPWNLPDQPPKRGPDAEGSDQGDGSTCRGG